MKYEEEKKTLAKTEKALSQQLVTENIKRREEEEEEEERLKQK